MPSSAGTAVAAPRLALDRHANRGQLRERRKRYKKAQGDGRQQKTPALFRARGFLSEYGLAVTYFRMRLHTIIGANPFHGPVRDGKAWVQAAMAARLKGWKK